MLGCRCNNLFKTGYKQVFVPQKGDTHRPSPRSPCSGEIRGDLIHANSPQNFFKQRETSRESIT
jgi:hypothetical protein